MVFGADNSKGETFYGNTLREAEEKARASEQVFINEKFTPQNTAVKETKKPVKQKLTKEEIFAWYAKEQKDWLDERGIEPARYEEDRVEQIYNAQ